MTNDIRFDTVQQASIGAQMTAKTFDDRYHAAMLKFLVDELGNLSTTNVTAFSHNRTKVLAACARVLGYRGTTEHLAVSYAAVANAVQTMRYIEDAQQDNDTQHKAERAKEAI